MTRATLSSSWRIGSAACRASLVSTAMASIVMVYAGVSVEDESIAKNLCSDLQRLRHGGEYISAGLRGTALAVASSRAGFHLDRVVEISFPGPGRLPEAP